MIGWYSFLTLINIIIGIKLYWPVIQYYVYGATVLATVMDSWSNVFKTYWSILLIFIKQWWHRTVLPLGNDRYMLKHIINNKSVKIIIKPNNKIYKVVVDEDFNECYLEETKPFFRYIIEPFNPKMIGIQKSLLLFESDSVNEIPLKLSCGDISRPERIDNRNNGSKYDTKNKHNGGDEKINDNTLIELKKQN